MRNTVITIGLALALLLAAATDAPAPTTKDRRCIVINTTEVGATDVAELDVEVDIEFETPGDGVNLLRDRVRSRPVERSRIRVAINDVDGSPIADLSVDLRAKVARRARGLRSTKTILDSSFDPPLTDGRAPRVRRPDTRFRRQWEESILNADGRVVAKQKASFDVRIRGVGEHTVAKTLRTIGDQTVVLDYQISLRGAPVADGTVILETTSAAGSGYMAGPIIVDDDDD